MNAVTAPTRPAAPPSAASDAPSSKAGVLLPPIDVAGIAGLGAVIAIHTTELSSKVGETAYLGLGYVLMIAASIVAIVLLAQRDRRGWLLGGATCLGTLVGFVLTRTTGLPGAHGDVGNWSETIATWSLIAEGLVVILSAAALTGTPRTER